MIDGRKCNYLNVWKGLLNTFTGVTNSIQNIYDRKKTWGRGTKTMLCGMWGWFEMKINYLLCKFSIPWNIFIVIPFFCIVTPSLEFRFGWNIYKKKKLIRHFLFFPPEQLMGDQRFWGHVPYEVDLFSTLHCYRI